MFRFAQLTLSPDMLQAVLDLPAGCALNKESIAALLVQAGVRHGLVPQALLSCLTAVASDRTLVIAQGQAAEPVRSARLVPPLDPATLPKAVTTGTCLGRYVAEDPGRPGVGVDGQVILPDAPLSLHIGRGFDLTGDGLLVANRDGLVECDETGLLRVALQTVATRKLARVLVQLEFSATQAWISLRTGEHLDAGTLQAGLDRAKVAFGILPEAFIESRRTAERPRRLLVARGQPPIQASPALIDHLFEPFALPGLEQFDGFDLADSLRQRLVEAGTPLFTVTPSAPGVPGTNVLGKIARPQAGRAVDIMRYLGEGTQIRSADARIVEAVISGLYQREAGGRVRVLELLEIHGNVDSSTGDIDSDLPLLIHGDITAGMRVKSSSDIIVLGSIADARVSARGNLLVQGGIGAGSQRVKAHNGLLAREITSRHVKARRMAVLGSIRDCEIMSADEVSALEVVGSTIVAARGLRCEFLGGAERPSRVEVGFDPLVREQETMARDNLPTLGQQAAALRQRCSLAAQEMNTHALDSESSRSAAEFHRLVNEYRQTVKRLSEAREILHQQRMRGGRAPATFTTTIEVTGTLQPGTTVVFGSVSRTIDTPLKRPRLALLDGQISW